MSHFTVLVISTTGRRSIKNQLKPFDENRRVRKYIKNTKEELIQRQKDSFKEHEKFSELLQTNPEEFNEKVSNKNYKEFIINEFPNMLSWTDEDFYKEATKYFSKKDFAPCGGEYSTYNPKAKWDWYQIGGRWTGMLRVKNYENGVDQTTKKNLDLEKLFNEEQYEKALRFWELHIDKQEPKTIEERKSIEHVWYRETYLTDTYKNKKTYAKCNASFSTYAVLKDDEWFEPGQMGWFGMSSETPEQKLDWELNYFDNFIKDLPDKALITLVDCHI